MGIPMGLPVCIPKAGHMDFCPVTGIIGIIGKTKNLAIDTIVDDIIQETTIINEIYEYILKIMSRVKISLAIALGIIANGPEPSPNNINPIEKRYAETIIYLKSEKRNLSTDG